MVCSSIILEKTFILLGLGISNKSVKKYFDKNNIKYYIYDDKEPIIVNQNTIVIKSPGFKNDNEFLINCKKNNILVITDIELFYLLRPDIKIIGITGTVGKTTCTTLLYNIIKHIYKTEVAGNIGIPIFDYIESYFDYLIVELSSFQLEYIKTFKPVIFIILNISPHHLNHHKNFYNYMFSKLKPCINLNEADYLLINETLIPHMSNLKLKCNINIFSNSINDDLFDFSSNINIGNINAISTVSKYLNIDLDIIRGEIKNFKGLEHRFETVYQNNNILIINDSKSTSFMSLNDAVKKIINNGYDRKIIILGGKIDNLEIEESIDFIKYLRTFEVYLYGENKEILNDIIKNPKSVCNTLEEVINIININEKLVILFSPGAQSLDQYSSYIERGREFKYLINKKLNKLEVI